MRGHYFVILPLILAIITGSNCMWFGLGANDSKCFEMDLEANKKFIVRYEINTSKLLINVPERRRPDFRTSLLTIKSIDGKTTLFDSFVESSEHNAAQDYVQVTPTIAGTYGICFSLPTDFNLNQGSEQLSSEGKNAQAMTAQLKRMALSKKRSRVSAIFITEDDLEKQNADQNADTITSQASRIVAKVKSVKSQQTIINQRSSSFADKMNDLGSQATLFAILNILIYILITYIQLIVMRNYFRNKKL